MPKINRRKKQSQFDNHTLKELIESGLLPPKGSFLAINIVEDKNDPGVWRWLLTNSEGEEWLMGFGRLQAITVNARRFHKFSGLPIYLNGKRHDGQ